MKIYSKLINAVLQLSIFTLMTSNTSAQTITSGSGRVVGSEDCRIRYSYDAAGNRIKREYRCISHDPYGNDPVPNTGIITVYPNPTTGVFHAEFSETVDEAYFVISASNGAVVQTYELMQPSQMVTFDITAQVPGTYFLTVWALNQEETHKIIKSQ